VGDVRYVDRFASAKLSFDHYLVGAREFAGWPAQVTHKLFGICGLSEIQAERPVELTFCTLKVQDVLAFLNTPVQGDQTVFFSQTAGSCTAYTFRVRGEFSRQRSKIFYRAVLLEDKIRAEWNMLDALVGSGLADQDEISACISSSVRSVDRSALAEIPVCASSCAIENTAFATLKSE
jgi:hypothetical protein